MEQGIQISSTPWWMQNEEYRWSTPVPKEFETLAGPRGVALVKAWDDGRTTAGWGTDDFMGNYMQRQFLQKRVLPGFESGRHAFAFVMRSVQMVCIDIDGKNGGFDHVGKLGMLPPTLAETSKSGNGYHLFYRTDGEWDAEYGYALLGDRINIEQGVDIRATGCVYHYDTQRWNSRTIAPLPDTIRNRILSRAQAIEAHVQKIKKVVESEDKVEVLMLHQELLEDLKKPIPAGRRNNTLFALGSQMKQAELPEWQQALADRANEVGLEADEVAKLLANIERYQPA